MSEESNKHYETSIEEAQEFYSNQSANVATISRTLVYSIIGTIWVLSFKDGSITKPHILLLIAIYSCFFYLLIDLSLYFKNSCLYHKQQLSLEKHKNEDDEDFISQKGAYNKKMISIHNCAYVWFWIKFILFILIAVIFLVGISIQLVK